MQKTILAQKWPSPLQILGSCNFLFLHQVTVLILFSESLRRKYIKKVGPLIVVAEDEGLGKAAKSIAGINVCRINNLCAEYLAPGAMPGRLTIWSKSAIEKLGE